MTKPMNIVSPYSRSIRDTFYLNLIGKYLLAYKCVIIIITYTHVCLTVKFDAFKMSPNMKTYIIYTQTEAKMCLWLFIMIITLTHRHIKLSKCASSYPFLITLHTASNKTQTNNKQFFADIMTRHTFCVWLGWKGRD